MNLHDLILETMTKIQSGETLTDAHYLVALAGLAALGVRENRLEGKPIDCHRHYSDMQDFLKALDSFSPEQKQ